MFGVYEVKLLKFLLDSGADPNITNSNKHGPLHYAITFRNKESVEILLKKGSDPNQQDVNGNTPLHFSAYENQTQIAQILLENKANPNQKNKRSATPLDIALRQNNKELAMLLLQNNASVNSQYNPLHLVFDKDKELLDLLLETAIKEKLDLNQPNKNGKTPLQRAEEREILWNAIRIRLYKIRLKTKSAEISEGYKTAQKDAFKKLIQQTDEIENLPISPNDKTSKMFLLHQKFFELEKALEETLEEHIKEKRPLEFIIKAYNQYAQTGDAEKAKKYILELQPSTSQTTLYQSDQPAANNPQIKNIRKTRKKI